MDVVDYMKSREDHMRLFNLLSDKVTAVDSKADVKVNTISGAVRVVSVKSDKGLALVDLTEIKKRIEAGEDEGELLDQAVEQLMKGEDRDNNYVNILDKSWVEQNVIFVFSTDGAEAARTVSRRVTDKVYLIVAVQITVNGESKVLKLDEEYKDLTFVNGVTEELLLEWAEKNTKKFVYKVMSFDKGMSCVSPGVSVFVDDTLDVIFADVPEHGLYVFPYNKDQVMILNNKEVSAEEAMDLYAGSLRDLEKLGVLKAEDRLLDSILVYKDGKFSDL